MGTGVIGPSGRIAELHAAVATASVGRKWSHRMTIDLRMAARGVTPLPVAKAPCAQLYAYVVL
jgi:hypothetical protein